MHPSEILDAATSLQESEAEALLRAAVHTSYYAFYHISKSYAEAHLGFKENRQESTHKQLSDCFLNACGNYPKDINMQEKLGLISQRLKDLHAKRVEADYFIATGRKFGKKETVKHVAKCKKSYEEIFTLQSLCSKTAIN